jgi:hypothetical protein
MDVCVNFVEQYDEICTTGIYDWRSYQAETKKQCTVLLTDERQYKLVCITVMSC